MKRKIFSLMFFIFFLMGYCLIFSPQVKAAFPSTSTSMWISYKGHLYEIRRIFNAGHFTYSVFDNNGHKITNLNVNDKKNLIYTFYFADNCYLKGIKYDGLKLLQSSMKDVLRYHYMISALSKFQDVLMKAGVEAVFAYFGNGLQLTKVMGNVLTKEMIDFLEMSPEDFARDVGRAYVMAGLSRLKNIIEFVGRRQALKMGSSAACPFDFEELKARYLDAVWVDCFLIPAAELVINFQRDPSLIGQLKDLGMVVVETALSHPAKTKKTIERFLKAKNIWGAFKSICPATARFVSEVKKRRLKWIDSEKVFLKNLQEAAPSSKFYADTVILALVDSSGSMTETDPKNLRISALKMLIQTLGSNIKLGIIDFDDHVKILAMPEVLGPMSSPTRQSLLGVLKNIDADGGTNISQGLGMAVDVLRQNNSKRKIIVLLTDGKDNNWHGEFDSKGQDIIVHTIALSDQADRDGLSRLSAATGGECEIARCAADLQRIMADLFGMAQGEELVFLRTGKIKQGETFVYPVCIEQGQLATDFMLTWPGSDIDLTLISPDRTRYTMKHAISRGYGITGSTFKLIKIKKPVPWTWQVEVFGKEIAPQGEDFTLRVAARQSLLKTRWVVKPVVPEIGEVFTISLFNKGEVFWEKAEITEWNDSSAPVKNIKNMDTLLAQISNFSSQTIYSFVPTKAGIKRIHILVRGKTPDGNLVMRSFDRTFRIAARGQGVHRKYEIDPFIRRK